MTPQAALTQWIEEEAAVRSRMLAGGGRPGLASPDLLAGRTGLEIMQAMLAGALPYPYMADTLDFALISVEPGKAVFQRAPQLKHYNPMGSVHRQRTHRQSKKPAFGEHRPFLVSQTTVFETLQIERAYG